MALKDCISNVNIKVRVKSHGTTSAAAYSHAAQLAAVLLCQLHQVKILCYISNITNMSDYSLFQELSDLCPSFLSLIFLALSAELSSNLDGDSVCTQVISVDVWLVIVPLQ